MSIQDRIKSERLDTERRKTLSDATLNHAKALGIDWQNYTDAVLIIANDLDDVWEYGLDEITDKLPVPTDPDFGAAAEGALSIHLSNLQEKVQLAARNLKELEAQISLDQTRIRERNLRSE